MDVLSAAEEEKKRKYQSACNDRRALFTPLCVSVDGMMGKEAGIFVKRLTERLSILQSCYHLMFEGVQNQMAFYNCWL